MAVEKDWRGKGIGLLVLKELEKIITEKVQEMFLHAGIIITFYEKHGYKIVKESYTLFGAIPHFLKWRK